MRLLWRRKLFDMCWSVGLAVGLTVPSVAAQGVRIPAADSRIAYVGQWGSVERDGQTAMATINSSSQIYLNFTGTHVTGSSILRTSNS